MKNLHNKEKQFAELLSDINLDINTSEVWEAIEHRLPEETSTEKGFFWRLAGMFFTLMLIAFAFVLIQDQDQSIAATHSFSDVSKNEFADNNEVFQKSAALEAAIDKVSSTTKVESSLVDSEALMDSKASVDETQQLQHINEVTPSTVVQTKNSNSLISRYFHLTNNSAVYSRPIIEEANTKKASSLTSAASPREALGQIGLLSLLTPKGVEQGNRSLTMSMATVVVSNQPSSLFFQMNTGFKLNKPNYFFEENERLSSEAIWQFESSLPGATVSLALGIETYNGWRFNGGFTYNQLVNRYNNQDFFSSSELIDGVQTFSLDESGISTPINGPIEQTTLVQNDINWHRQFHNVDLFAGVGKKLFQLSDWSIATEVSLLLNVFTSGTGYVFDTDFNSINKFPQEIKNPFETMGLGTAFSFQIERDFENGFTLFCSPSFSKYYRQLTSDSFYKTNNSQLGLQIGLKYWPRG